MPGTKVGDPVFVTNMESPIYDSMYKYCTFQTSECPRRGTSNHMTQIDSITLFTYVGDHLQFHTHS